MNSEILERLDLFRGLKAEEIRSLCENCFRVQIRRYNKGATIISEGEIVRYFGIVLDGQAHSYKTALSGKNFSVSVIEQGGYIGALLAGLAESGRLSPVTVVADEQTTVMFIPFEKMLRQCKSDCAVHSRVLSNFVSGICSRAMGLYERIDCIIKPTIREKVMSYLLQNRYKNVVEIPFNREVFAEYLNTDRSALSRELTKMKKDGLIDYHLNTFKIL